MVQNGRFCPDHACVHKFLDFCNPYGVICMFSKVPDGTGLGSAIGSCPLSAYLWLRWGALRMVTNGPEWSRTFDNGPEWSPGALGRVSGGPERGSLEVFRGCMGSPGTVLRGLVRVMCARRGFMGSPKLEILSFLQPLWCDLHVFQGPTWRGPSESKMHWPPYGAVKIPLGGLKRG